MRGLAKYHSSSAVYAKPHYALVAKGSQRRVSLNPCIIEKLGATLLQNELQTLGHSSIRTLKEEWGINRHAPHDF